MTDLTDTRAILANLTANLKRTDDVDDAACPGDVCDGTGWAYNAAGEAYSCPACTRARRDEELAEQLSLAGVGERYLTTAWADLELLAPLDKLAAVDVTRVIATGHHAILTGPPGTGKTQAGVLLARSAIEAGYHARVANLGALAMEVRAAYNTDGLTEHEVVRALALTDLLVLDDVGAGESGGGQVEARLLYQVTEARQNARRPTIVTTNLDAKTLASAVGSRVMNRLAPAKVYAFTHGRNFRGGTPEDSPWL